MEERQIARFDELRTLLQLRIDKVAAETIHSSEEPGLRIERTETAILTRLELPPNGGRR